MTIGLKVDTTPEAGGNGGSITAGSILYGRVYLSVKHEEAAHSIRLKVIGKEKAVVHHTTQEEEFDDNGNNNNQGGGNGRSRTRTRDDYERSTHDIWNVDHPIKEFPNGKIPRGQYEFPFALQLPESLPSTMSSKCGQSTCEVRYEVVAEVFQKPNSMFYTNTNAKEELTVVALSSVTSPEQDTSLQLPIEIVPINQCCCFTCSRQGTMALETKFNQTTLLLPEPSSSSAAASTPSRTRTRTRPNNQNKATAYFGIQFRCENKSTAKVKSIRAQLIETIEWTVHGHTETIKTVMATSTKDAALYPELDAMWRKPFRWEQHRYNGGNNNNNNNDNDSDSGAYLLLQHKPWRTIEPPLGVPITAKDTYRGRAVQVRHVLTLSLITKGCCSTNPDVSSLIEIYRSPTASTAAVAVAGGTASHDPLSCKKQEHRHHHHTPSAPFQDEPAAATTAAASSTMSQASAPSDQYDDSYAAAAAAGYYKDDNGVLPNYNDSTSAAVVVPMVEAQLVLPEDWSAVTAEIVTIPIAEATVLSSSSTATDGFAGTATGYSK